MGTVSTPYFAARFSPTRRTGRADLRSALHLMSDASRRWCSVACGSLTPLNHRPPGKGVQTRAATVGLPSRCCLVCLSGSVDLLSSFVRPLPNGLRRLRDRSRRAPRRGTGGIDAAGRGTLDVWGTRFMNPEPRVDPPCRSSRPPSRCVAARSVRGPRVLLANPDSPRRSSPVHTPRAPKLS